MNLFDEKIKRELDNISSTVPSDMWDRIERQLPKEENDNKFLPFIYWGIGILGVSLFLGLYFYMNSSVVNGVENQLVVERVDSSKELINKDTKNNPLSEILAIAELSIEEKNSPIFNKNSVEVINNEIQNENKKTKIDKTIARVNLTEYDEKVDQHLKVESQIDHSKIKKDIRNEDLSISSEKNPFTLNSNLKREINVEEFKNIFKQSKLDLVTENLSLRTELNVEKLQNVKSLNYLSLSSGIKPPHLIKEPNCPDMREAVDEHFYFEAHFNPIYNKYTLEAKTDEFDEYSLMRSSTEKTRLSYNFGFRTGFVNEKGFAFTTGLEFTQLNSKFNHLDSTATRKITIIDTIYTDEGYEVTVKNITVYGTNEIRAYNYMTMLDIPLLFSYEFELYSRMKLNLTAGAFLNLNFAHESRIVNPEDIPTWVSSSSEDYKVYKDGVGVSFYLSTGFHYKISNNMYLLMEPNVRLYSENFTIGSYPLKESHQLFGLRTGLRYIF